ncbi:cupin domain-containing protein [candidate division KSB1 bacterium]|nr:cupin domain-containing protein [candidate division KSB1 bacterium]
MTDKQPLEQRIREQAINWNNDLTAQSDAIVSKTLVEQKTGTITVFAFDKGQALSEHTAPFDAFVHILSGTMKITLAGKPITVNQGESLIMPANIPHALEAGEPARMLLVMIRS